MAECGLRIEKAMTPALRPAIRIPAFEFRHWSKQDILLDLKKT
jgi:hypothetical protein